MNVLTSNENKRSIGEALNGHNNSLGLIRLILASLVIVDHAFPLGGFGHDPMWVLTRGQASLGSLAVGGFFAISGYLVTKSGATTDVVQFLWRRGIRIFPAFWVVLLVTALIVAPAIWVSGHQPLGEYFQNAPTGPWVYLTGNWTLHIGTYGIYDLLATTTPYGQEVGASVFNGSLWTLWYEWSAYLIIALLVAFGIVGKYHQVIAGLTLWFFALEILKSSNATFSMPMVPGFLADSHMVDLLFTFFLGATVAAYSRFIPFDNRLGIVSALVMLFSLRFGGFSTIGTIAATYMVLYLAARLPKRLHWIGQKNDYSYGIYIYGFLVQQVFAYLHVNSFGIVPFIGLSWLVAFPLAMLSWHIVEKWALRLKDWGPGKGVKFWWGKVESRWRT